MCGRGHAVFSPLPRAGGGGKICDRIGIITTAAYRPGDHGGNPCPGRRGRIPGADFPGAHRMKEFKMLARILLDRIQGSPCSLQPSQRHRRLRPPAGGHRGHTRGPDPGMPIGLHRLFRRGLRRLGTQAGSSRVSAPVFAMTSLFIFFFAIAWVMSEFYFRIRWRPCWRPAIH